MTLSLTPIVATERARVNAVSRYFAAAICAGGAGIHLALVPEHLHEGGPMLGAAFALSAGLLALAALTVRHPRHDSWAPHATIAVLIGTAAAYVLSRTTGLPPLISTPEATDLLGELTSAFEVAAAIACFALITRKDAA